MKLPLIYCVRLTVACLLLMACTAVAAEKTVRHPISAFQTAERIPKRVDLEQAVVRAQPVRVDLDRLADVEKSDRLDLSIPATDYLVGTVTRIERRGTTRFTVKGTLDVDPLSSFILVVVDDVAVGVIRLPATDELYRLRYVGEDVHLFMEIDQSLFPPEQCFITPAIPTFPDDSSQDSPTGHGFRKDVAGTCPAPPITYDLVMAYTHLARQAMGSTNAAIAQCQLAVEVGNEAYANSQVNTHLRLVHTMEVTYAEAGTQEDWLDWLTGQGSIGAIGTAREQYGADFVNMLTAGGSGIGWCGGGVTAAYSCAKWTRAVDSWTLVHEMGHNQGCNHNREDRGEGCGTGYHHGWHFWGDSGTEWGTVMSYAGIRVPHFSNPYVYWDGQPTGIPIGETNESYTAKVHNDIAPYAQNYRLTRSDIWVDFDRLEYYTQTGTYLEPYNTVQEGLDNIVHGVGAGELPNIWFAAASSTFTGTISDPVTFRACGGGVLIGVSP